MPNLTGYKKDNTGTYITKDPSAVLDYTLDWSEWLPSGDEISSSTVTIQSIAGDSAPLTLDSNSSTTNTTTAIISGGTAGNKYNIEYTIVTSDSKTDSRNFRIFVQERQV
tara:strand:+ start:3503 stop:3832 length:330 start_codon:yes stop_codon:yes gene_type:complete